LEAELQFLGRVSHDPVYFTNFLHQISHVCSLLKAGVDDRRRASQRRISRCSWGCLHSRRFCHNADTLHQAYPDPSEEVPNLRARGVSGEAEGGARGQHQPDRRHSHKLCQAGAQGEDPQSHLPAQ